MKNRHTLTVVEYSKEGTNYLHTFPEVLGPSQIEQRMLMELHVAAHSIITHYYK